ncbi:replication restart DNA helicase PriA [Rathayibacter sp. PhB151]|uniref:primosomal protein N' family DNA-binding protein n=1 Tax=Rathayibacter sp. PhB151 TaxID=2485189 RepID=UPI001063C78D|nr:primosomal protein N' [Rathayibacter sp. PhB151]TDX79303.1 replication restart DNA helicase PriA [Rathayibacter sp. PhB151]
MTGPAGRVARVLLDSPLPQLDRLLDYAIPEALRDGVRPGVRVRVPLRTGGRIADAFVVEVGEGSEHAGALSELEELVSPLVVLTPEVWALARRVADRAAGGASDVLRLAVPRRHVRVERAHLAALAEVDAAAVPSESDADSAPAEPVADGTVPGAVTGYPAETFDRLLDGGRLAVNAVPAPVQLASGAWVGGWAVTLAELARTALAAGRDAILAVPDYRDQEQLEQALAEHVPEDAVVRLDARQKGAGRYAAFLRCLTPGPRVIVGNRSVLYAPSSALGLIALWDDGDPLFAEPLAPYAHARDVALVRQEQSGAGLVLLGNTRTVEVERLVGLGFAAPVQPRPSRRPHVVPTAQQTAADEHDQAARIPSTAWRQARIALDSGPVLVQVARPGYAPVVACARCRTVARCNRCQGPLAVHAAGARPSCGWCGLIAADWHCSVCEATALRLVSLGAGRTAEELGRAFPGVKVVVADGAHPILTVPGTPALVVATRGGEPRADGGYHAVLLLDGERMLARESLRVADDALRTWSNAAALARPGAPVLLVGVAGRLATALATWRQDEYLRAELIERRELRFPPAVRLATVSGDAHAVTEALDALDEADRHEVLGPVGLEDGSVRAIVRFDYARGAEVAARLRSAVIRNATRRRRPPTTPGRFRPAPKLRVRLDDPDIL